MDKVDKLVSELNDDGNDVVVLIRKGKDVNYNGKYFSSAYISSEVEQVLPFNLLDLVDSCNIKKYERRKSNSLITMSIPLDNPDLIHNYVNGIFKLLRQVPCKSLAKLWIKLIEPGKKTKFPYIKGNAMKPSWWPNGVEHREPDHLKKPDRLQLMCSLILEVLPRINNLDLVEDIVRVTLSLPIFKNNKIKESLIISALKISNSLILGQNIAEGVINLKYVNKKNIKDGTMTEEFKKDKAETDESINLIDYYGDITFESSTDSGSDTSSFSQMSEVDTISEYRFTLEDTNSFTNINLWEDSPNSKENSF